MAIFRKYQQWRIDIWRVAYTMKHSITKQLLVVVFSIYLVITICITLIHMDFEYEFSKRQTIAALKNLQNMIHNSVSQAIWEFNTPQLDAILNGIYNNQYLVGVKLEIPASDVIPDFGNKEIGLIENAEGEIIDVNPIDHTQEIVHSTFERLIPYGFDIQHVDALGRTLTIGRMYLYSSNKIVFSQVKDSYILIIVNAMIKTFALWVFFLWAGYYYISKPLAKLSEAIKQLAIGNWNIELVELKVNPNKKEKTEINTLFETFNDMARNLLQTQDKLKQSRNRLNNIFDTMPSAIIAVDNQYVIHGWNKYIVQVTGIESKDAINRKLTNIFPAFDEYLYLVNQALKQKREQQVQHVKIAHNDSISTRLYQISVFPIKDNVPPEAVIRIDDVTEQVKTEAGMAQVEKLASVGASIAGVAHEINNPLGSIMQSTQNILRRIDPSLPVNQETAATLHIDLEKQHQYLQQREIIKFLNDIHQAGDRASSIVKNMLKFTRRSTAEMEKHNLIEIINDALQISANDISIQEHIDFKDIKIVKKLNIKHANLECNQLEIQQVLINLIRNAAQALNPTQPEKIIIIEAENLGDDKVQIKVVDNGHGMSQETMAQVFQPFFTTKPAGQGTGLGLSVCRNIIVQKHHGNMEVQSTLNRGTTFIITLPLSQKI